MKGVILFILLFCASSIFGQNFSYTQFTVNDGLPSNETYSILQDKEGYIWIGTDRGVNRFNGYEFETFTTDDGLPDNTIFNFYQDHKGRIWFYSFNGKIGFYSNGKFNLIPIKSKPFIKSIYVNKEDDVSIEYYNTAGTWLHFHLNKDVVDQQSVHWNTSKIITEDEKKVSRKLDPTAYFLWTEKRAGRKQSFGDGLTLLTTKIDNNTLCLIHQNQVHIVDSNLRIKHNLPVIDTIGEIKSIGKTKNYWYVSYSSNIFLKYDLTSYTLLETVDLGTFELSAITIDRFGGTWMSTLNAGVIYAPNNNIGVQSVAFENYTPALFNKSANNTTIVPSNGLVYSISKGKIIQKTPSIFGTIEQIRRTKNGFFIPNQIQLLQFNNNGDLHSDFNSHSLPYGSEPEFRHLGFYDGFISQEGMLISCSKEFVYIDSTVIRINGASRLVTLAEQNDTVWAGGINGLFAFSKKTKKQLKIPSSSLLKNRINQLKFSKDDLLMTTRGAGLLILHEGKVYQIKKIDGLQSNSTKHVESDGNKIWVSSNSGICVIEIRSYAPFQFEIKTLGPQDGLFSKEINDIQLFGDSLYILSNTKLFALHKSYRGNSAKPYLIINGLISKNTDKRLLLSTILDYDDNNLVLQYTGLYFPNANGLTYYYSLDKGKNWLKTTERSITLLNLADGDYSILIKVVTSNGIASQTERISFTIRPPFWKAWWFITLIIALLIIIVWLAMKRYVKRINRVNAIKSELIKLEHKALSSQMNPHFIFNAMNSIQHYILKKDKYEAYNYLGQFATLMRSILKNSQKERVVLSDEIQQLSHYLNLEQIRFDYSFDYEIEVDAALDIEDIFVPGMLIQPFAENSIRHGFAPKDEKGQLTIQFFLENNVLKCVVEDNGIGRVKAKEYSDFDNHESFGISINQRRLELMNDLYKEHVSLVIEDLYQKNRASGTRVTISIPLINK